MTETMIERAARAILAKVPSGYGMTAAEAMDYARAAIAAMREPTKMMIVKGGDVLDDCKDSDWDSGSDGDSYNSYEWIISGSQTTIYQAMIDEALADKPKGK